MYSIIEDWGKRKSKSQVGLLNNELERIGMGNLWEDLLIEDWTAIKSIINRQCNDIKRI